jgi:hypothetical protein
MVSSLGAGENAKQKGGFEQRCPQATAQRFAGVPTDHARGCHLCHSSSRLRHVAYRSPLVVLPSRASCGAQAPKAPNAPLESVPSVFQMSRIEITGGCKCRVHFDHRAVRPISRIKSPAFHLARDSPVPRTNWSSGVVSPDDLILVREQ